MNQKAVCRIHNIAFKFSSIKTGYVRVIVNSFSANEEF